MRGSTYQLNNDKDESMISCNEQVKLEPQPPTVRWDIYTKYKDSLAFSAVRDSEAFSG